MIKVLNNYYITKEPNGGVKVIKKEQAVRQKDGKDHKKGDLYVAEIVVGYHSKLQNSFQIIFEEAIRDKIGSEDELKELKEFISEIKQIKDYLTQMFNIKS